MTQVTPPGRLQSDLQINDSKVTRMTHGSDSKVAQESLLSHFQVTLGSSHWSHFCVTLADELFGVSTTTPVKAQVAAPSSISKGAYPTSMTAPSLGPI